MHGLSTIIAMNNPDTMQRIKAIRKGQVPMVDASDKAMIKAEIENELEKAFITVNH